MDYTGVNAKVKAMGSRLLKYEDYAALSRLKTVEEVGLRLRDLPDYQKAMENISELRRESIEQKLLFSFTMDFYKIYHFITDFKLKKYLDAYFLKVDIQMLKIMLCMVYDERSIPYTIPELTSIVDPKLKIDFAKVLAAKTVPEFIESLNDTRFYKILSNVQSEKISLFELQMQLDLYYYLQLWTDQSKLLGKRDQAVMDELIGVEIDFKNLMWIYRFKNYYNMNSSLIYSFLIPIHRKIKNTDMNRLVETRSADNFLEEVATTKYKKLASSGGAIEELYYKEMLKLYHKTKMEKPDSISTIASYIFRKELEIYNLTSLLEGVRYSLESKEILSYLYFPDGTEVS